MAFGSNLNEQCLAALKERIATAAGTQIRSGDALAGELEGDWAPGTLARLAGTAEESVDSQRVETSSGDDEVTWSSPSALALILANCVPLAGAALLDWNLGAVMVTYWAESAVIGFFNLLKIAVIGRWMALLAGPFFVGHFGGFMVVHFLFLYTIFVKGVHGDPSEGSGLGEVSQLFVGLWPALAALVVSHAYSFLHNFIGRKECLGRTLNDQMSEPYSRIIFMQLVLIFGGGLALILGEPQPVLLLVIVLKILMDLRAHLRQRRSRESLQPGGRPVSKRRSTDS